MKSKIHSVSALKALTIFSGFFLLGLAASSQPRGINGYGKTKWVVKDPFEQWVFVENNEGQQDGKADEKGDKILYTTRITGVDLYFRAHGLTYRHDEYPDVKGKNTEADEGKDYIKDIKSHYLDINWAGSNANVEVEAEDEVSFYYCYPKSCKHTTIAHAFKKIVYKNLYPGIDVEYFFPEDRTGIEYSVIVHPGADLSQVRMIYTNAKGISRNATGDIEIASSMGLFTDHAPSRTYYTEDGSTLQGSFKLTGKEVSFEAGDYDHSKTLVIDPWPVNPTYTGYDAAYDICYDLKGNVYAYGSFSPFQLIKVNSTGTIQWVFDAVFPSSWGGIQYGDFAVDENTGTSYCTSSGDAMMLKVNTLGIQTDSLDLSSQMNEIWRMAYNHCEGQIVIAGGGTAGNYQMAVLDTSLTTFNPVNVLGTVGGHRDVSLLAIDNATNYCYWATAESNTFPSSYDNILLKTPLPSFLPITYSVSDGFVFTEACCDVNYIDGVGGHSLAMNGMVVSPNWVYGYDGQTLRRYSKSTGITASTKTMSSISYNWGGIDVDICDNMYLGNNDTIEVLDSALNKTGGLLAANQIYDLHVMPGNMLCACGKSFIETFTITTNPMTLNVTQTSPPCGSSTGTATAMLTGCGSDSSQYAYLWSTGATTQTVTGLAPGTYTVTVSSSCDFRYTDSVTIKTSGSSTITLTSTEKNVSCNGLKNGSATVTASGGKPPYSYDWNIPGDTTATITNLGPGTYTVTVSDSAGCNTIVVTITQPPVLTATISSSTNVGCKGGNTGAAAVTAAGGTGHYTYSWAPAGGTKDSAKNLGAGVYTVTVTDSSGCTAIATDSIKAPVIPVPVIAGNDTVCSGSTTVLTASGGGSYTWSTGATTNSISITPSSSITYTVTATIGACSADTTFKVTVLPAPTPAITATRDTICAGLSNSVLTASGGTSYVWSTGATTSTITVSPSTTTTYTLTAKTGKCSATVTKTITVMSTAPPVITSSNDSICSGSSATLTVTGGTKYTWSTGATTSSISVSPGSTTSYSVIVSSQCFSDTLNQKVFVTPLPVPTIVGNDSICPGTNTVLTASGGTTYVWNTGKTTASITVAPTSNTTYTVTAFNGKCSATAVFTVKTKPIPIVTVTGSSIVCKGDSITLTATGGGTYYWSIGATTSSITVAPTSNTNYYVVVTKGCADTTYHAVTITSITGVTACCDTTILPGGTVNLNASGVVGYVWSPSSSVDCFTCPNTNGTPGGTATTYTVVGTDSNGCKSFAYITVGIECMDFIVPNVFTPNGDHYNDLFVIKAVGEPEYQITIYNRWGVVMFKSSNPADYWDGKNQSNGELVSTGVYYYIIKSSCDGHDYDKHGFVQVIDGQQ